MRSTLLASLLFALTSCNASVSESEYVEEVDSAPAVGATPVALETAVRPVQCGCTIESVGHCGEYADVDGAFVALQFPAGQDHGKMPFCGKEGLTAEVGGSLEDGKLVATTFELK